LIVRDEMCEFSGFEKVDDVFFEGCDEGKIGSGLVFGGYVRMKIWVGAGWVEDAETVV